ncbi:hypothetical protein EV424DRAFT_1353292 [Suillus variegatus]|nr:hypothetical protein EV424DRAFT_1353292 [Suillus variegatus]
MQFIKIWLLYSASASYLVLAKPYSSSSKILKMLETCLTYRYQLGSDKARILEEVYFIHYTIKYYLLVFCNFSVLLSIDHIYYCGSSSSMNLPMSEVITIKILQQCPNQIPTLFLSLHKGQLLGDRNILFSDTTAA